MKKIKVYRFELNGVGPYSHKISDFDCDSDQECAIINILETIWTSKKEEYPDIFSDIQPEITSKRIKRKIYSACLSKEDLLEWFKWNIRHLKILGFALLEYTVEEDKIFYTKSGKQIGFYRKNAPFKALGY